MTQQKINVLFVIHGLGAGGSERVVLNLARALDRSKFQVFLAAFAGGALEQSFEKSCERIFYIHKKEGFDINAIIQLYQIIKDYSIDIINAHHFMPFFYSFAGCKILGRKVCVYTEHSVPEVKSLLLDKYTYFYKLMLQKADAIICVSKDIASTFQNFPHIHNKKIKYIPNGVNVQKFTSQSFRDNVRAEWGVSKNDLVIGMVANLIKVKNPLCLVRAFHRLSRKMHGIKLVLVGKGYPALIDNTEHEIREFININMLNDQVILAGYREDIPAILCGLDIFCLTSYSEGLPVSVLEAMAASLPIVGSDVTGIREIISNNKTGILFRCNDDEQLAKILEQLISDSNLRYELGKNAFSHVLQNHGLERFVVSYENIFISSLSQNRHVLD